LEQRDSTKDLFPQDYFGGRAEADVVGRQPVAGRRCLTELATEPAPYLAGGQTVDVAVLLPKATGKTRAHVVGKPRAARHNLSLASSQHAKDRVEYIRFVLRNLQVVRRRRLL
jgi:hypothetical protein